MNDADLSAEDMEEVLLTLDEMEDFPVRNGRAFYILQNESEPGPAERIRLPNLEKYFPLKDIKDNHLEGLDKEGFFMQVSGSYYPDFLQEKGLTFFSSPLLDYLKTKIDTEEIEYNWIGLISDGGKRNEEYRLVIPERLDCIRQESIRRNPKSDVIEYLELDETKIPENGIFRAEGFPYLLVTEKLNRLRYSGFRCIRLENFFHYEEVRDQDYRERAAGLRLAAVTEIYEEKGNATGTTNYKFGLRQVIEAVKRAEIEQGLKSIFDSFEGEPFPTDRLFARFLDFTWSPERLEINLVQEAAEHFRTTGFTIPSMAQVRDYVAKLPEELRQDGEKVVTENILRFAITACSRIFDTYENIHGGQRFRLYLWDETSPSANPPLIYDYKDKFQKEVEQATDLSRFDLSQKDLREFDLSHKNLRGVKISGSNLRRTNLQEANLTGVEMTDCNLAGTQFTKSIMDGAKIKDCRLDRTNFDGAGLKRAEIENGLLQQMSLVRSDLTGAKITGFNLSKSFFYRAKLSGTLFEIPGMLDDNAFRLCDMREARFLGNADEFANLLSGCDFSNSDLTACQFEVKGIKNTAFTKSKLLNVTFSRCRDISDCDFRGSSCIGMNIAGVWLYNNDFSGVDLSQIKPRKEGIFVGNNFTNASLAGYDF
ncbi:MAG TPA: hypothetical protein DDW50_10235, partial [Firmicutes bacterium]|nr:hypothetical protein [Bacillota bacterium]